MILKQCFLLILTAAVLITTAGTIVQSDEPAPVWGYINHIPKEDPEAREERLKKVTERREGVMLLVHRGAYAFAPENTLEAFAAAMDHGADGVEMDIRRSKDGVLYLHHDDVLGRQLEGSGRMNELTYYEILSRPLKGAGRRVHLPTFPAFLELARQRAMLLHLDVKESGTEDEIIRLLDEADMWDHVVHVTPSDNSNKIRFHDKARLYEYKGWWHEAGTTDESRKAFLEREARMIFIGKDPTEAAEWLNKQKEGPIPVPRSLQVHWLPNGPVTAE